MIRFRNGTIRRCWTALTAACVATMTLASMHGNAQSLPWAEARAQVVALARTGKIAEIEAAVLSAQDEFERDQTNDQRIAGLLEGISDKRLPFYNIEMQLNQWVESAPQSYAARLMRGRFLAIAGARARGTAWARLTTEGQFAQMKQLHERSRVDLLAATRLTRVPLHARMRLMWNALLGGQSDVFREQYQLALAHSPGNMRLRRSWMESLEPRWGGSYPAMSNYAQESARALSPAHAATLRSLALADEAWLLNTASSWSAAEKKFNDAIRIADTPDHRVGRAEALAELGRAEDAATDLRAAFNDPVYTNTHAADVLTQLARKHPKLDGVNDLVDALIERHPDHAHLRNLRGFRLQQGGDQARAYPDFRAAGETGDAWAETMVGKYIFNGFGGVPVNREEGLNWLRRAASKGEPNAQLSVKQALEMMGRQGDISTAQAEFQRANPKAAEKARKTQAAQEAPKTREALANPELFLWHQLVTWWHEYYRYIALYLAALVGVMLILIRKDDEK